jgi:FAD dependent oxidoreductase
VDSKVASALAESVHTSAAKAAPTFQQSSLMKTILSLLFCLNTAFAAEQADVVVVTANPAGISAAVAAARSGASVILLDEHAHVGGIIAGGLSNIDNVNTGAVGGLFNDFKRRIVEHYSATYGKDSEQVKDCKGGTDFEPKVAEQVFREMLSSEPGIRVILRQRLRGVQKEGQRLTSVTMEDLSQPGKVTVFAANTFIDCSYEGDLAALAGVPYRVGRESRGEYGEPLAGRIYMDLATKEILPGSTGEADRGIQAFCFRFPLTQVPENRVPVTKPAGYNRDDYRDLLADVKEGKIKTLRDTMQLRKAPNGKYISNNDHTHPGKGSPRQSLDLAEENWDWPEAGHEARARMFARYWSYNEGFLWFLQNDPEVPEPLRDVMGRWGFCKDEFPDNGHRPWHLYVREGRRILGESTFTTRDAEADPATGKPQPRADAIALVEYGFDSHAVRKYDPAHPGVREGYVLMKHPITQLPYGIVVPQKVDGLLVPVACSASRLAYQTIRMEPVFMALGEACGIAAMTAKSGGTTVRNVDVKSVQREIVKRGGVILHDDQAN